MRRQGCEIDAEWRLAPHAERGRVDQKPSSGHRVRKIREINNLDGRTEIPGKHVRALPGPVDQKNTCHPPRLEGMNNRSRRPARAENNGRAGAGLPSWRVLIHGTEKTVAITIVSTEFSRLYPQGIHSLEAFSGRKPHI